METRSPRALVDQMRAAGVTLWTDDETLLELYEERAAIMEYCGGLPREEAERQAFQRYRSETHGGQMPDLLHGILLSRFNLWLEAQGQRPTTLLALWIALGMADVSSAPPSLI